MTEKKPGCLGPAIGAILGMAASYAALVAIFVVWSYIDARLTRLEGRVGLKPCAVNLDFRSDKPMVVCP